jgi:hypothetical protein
VRFWAIVNDNEAIELYVHREDAERFLNDTPSHGAFFYGCGQRVREWRDCPATAKRLGMEGCFRAARDLPLTLARMGSHRHTRV